MAIELKVIFPDILYLIIFYLLYSIYGIDGIEKYGEIEDIFR